MKTIKVVAAAICDSLENTTKILPLPEGMVNSRENGNSPEESLNSEKHRSKL